jgi:hypothetical protein
MGCGSTGKEDCIAPISGTVNAQAPTKGIEMRRVSTIIATLALALAFAAPAMAATGADGAGQAYGQHHAAMAQEMGGFSGTMNPGVMHQGFSGWTPM